MSLVGGLAVFTSTTLYTRPSNLVLIKEERRSKISVPLFIYPKPVNDAKDTEQVTTLLTNNGHLLSIFHNSVFPDYSLFISGFQPWA